jgi:hypothetical protein
VFRKFFVSDLSPATGYPDFFRGQSFQGNFKTEPSLDHYHVLSDSSIILPCDATDSTLKAAYRKEKNYAEYCFTK